MAHQWTQEDQEDWDYLDSKTFHDRTVDEEMRYKQLTSLLKLRVMDKKEAMRKAGPFHKPAVVFLLLGLSSCGGAFISWSDNADRGITGWWFAAVGIGLLLLSTILNGLNNKMTGQDE